jgi:cytochrome P450
MIQHASVFIGAGSETSAGILTAATSYLVDHPDKLAKLEQEIRSAFRGDAEVRHEEVSRLPYLVACLDETMRLYPQTGVPSLRVAGNDVICGVKVPSGASLNPVSARYRVYG